MSVAKFRWNLSKYLSVGNQRRTLCISLRDLAEQSVKSLRLRYGTRTIDYTGGFSSVIGHKALWAPVGLAFLGTDLKGKKEVQFSLDFRAKCTLSCKQKRWLWNQRKSMSSSPLGRQNHFKILQSRLWEEGSLAGNSFILAQFDNKAESFGQACVLGLARRIDGTQKLSSCRKEYEQIRKCQGRQVRGFWV